MLARTPWHYLYRGFALLSHKSLRLYVITPLVINVLLFIGLFYLGMHFFSHFVNFIEQALPTWLSWLRWILWPLFVLALILLWVYTFTFIANLVSAPFNGFLSEKTESLITGTSPAQALTWRNVLAQIPYALSMQMRLMLYYLPRAALCLVLFFVPVIQVIAPFLWFLLNAWMMAVQYLDYPAENHQIPFSDFRKKITAARWPAFGFGTSVMLASMVPLLNLIVIPSAVIGATLFWIDMRAPRIEKLVNH